MQKLRIRDAADLREAAKLIDKANDGGNPVAGWDHGQRPHVFFDDIQLQTADAEVFLRIACGDAGVVKSVPAPVAAYIERLCALPGVKAWIDGALAEKDFLDFEEPYRLARD